MEAHQQILVPVDGSTASLRACDQAVELASGLGANLMLLQVLEPPPHLFPRVVTDELRSATLEALEERAALLRPYVNDVVATIAEGTPWREIVEVAAKLPADLVIIGTTGLRGLTRLIMGSVAERVVRAAPAPVLTVPAHAFSSREKSAPRLASAVSALALGPPAVVALSRGALPIASQLARSLSGTLDLWLVVPLAAGDRTIGAMGEDGLTMLDPGRTIGETDRIAIEERARMAMRAELESLRGVRAMAPTGDRAIVLVTDGLATASPVIVAARALRLLRPRALVLATPIANKAAFDAASEQVDHAICLERTIVAPPESWYETRSLPSDRQAHALLEPNLGPSSQPASRVP
jgi:nucleotide-binding universal stress UspA family protein